jgi:hypothetical protein
MFEHKNIHFRTWKSPDALTFNQIDHVLRDGQYVSDLLDVKTHRGANINSDHFLVLTCIQLRISTVKKLKGEKGRKLNCEKLRSDDIAQMYAHKVSEYLVDSDQGHNTLVEERCRHLPYSISKAATEVLGEQDKGRKTDNWFDGECKSATNAKNKAYGLMQQRRYSRSSVEAYCKVRREEKEVCRRRKREYENWKMEELEELHKMKQARKFYKEINKVHKEYKPRLTVCKNEQGEILSDKASILDRWQRYFGELLARQVCKQAKAKTGEDSIRHLDGEERPPSWGEVTRAIQRLKNGKAPGSDTLQAELYKFRGRECEKKIRELILTIWDAEGIPKEWNLSLICPILKKRRPVNLLQL